MSKTISAALQAHIAGETTTLATCWKVTRSDSTVLGFTDHDRDITYDSVTYEASSGYTASQIRTTADLAVDNLDVTGLLISDGITEADLIAGLYDDAEVEIFLINWNDTSQGILKLPGKGWIGEVSLHRDTFVAEIRGLAQALQQVVGEIYTPVCRADFGDTRCQVPLSPSLWQASTAYTATQDYDANIGDIVKPTTQTDPPLWAKCTTAGTSDAVTYEPTWPLTEGGTVVDGTVTWTMIKAYTVTSTVTTVTDRATFSIDEGIAQDDFFVGGKVTFTSGSNNGLEMEVKTHDFVTGAQHDIVVTEKFPYSISVGNTLTITAGCRKRLADCQTFNNVYNRRAEDYLPGIDEIMKFGGQ